MNNIHGPCFINKVLSAIGAEQRKRWKYCFRLSANL